MLDVVAILSASERTADLARSALPDSPVRADPPLGTRFPRPDPIRQRVGLILRRLADLVEPAPTRGCAGADRR